MPGSVLRFTLLVCVVSVLAGCSSTARKNKEVCNEPQEYQTARSVPPLKIPEGLDEPDRRERLVIPGRVDPDPYPNGRPCLERPPDYFGRGDQAADQ